MQRGDGCTLFEPPGGKAHADRALLLIWPNNPDAADNPHVRGDASSAELPPVWDCECLLSYVRVGGRTVLYVGEREDQVQSRIWERSHGRSHTIMRPHTAMRELAHDQCPCEAQVRVLPEAAPDCGASSSRRFQSVLAEHFELVQTVRIHSWVHNSDDLTVWRRRSTRSVVVTAPDGSACSLSLPEASSNSRLLGGAEWPASIVLGEVLQEAEWADVLRDSTVS